MAFEIHHLLEAELKAAAKAGKLLISPTEIDTARANYKVLCDLYLFSCNKEQKWGSSYTDLKEQAKKLIREKSKAWGDRMIAQDPTINGAWIAKRMQALMILRDSLSRLEEREIQNSIITNRSNV